MTAELTDEECNSAFYEALWNNPPERLIMPAEQGFAGADLSFGNDIWREYRIWEGYIDASSLLLDHMTKGLPNSRGLIFPAMFNLRHAMEVALKWHIRYAGGAVPKGAGHSLDLLIELFRQTADGLYEDTTYICDYILGLIAELAAVDPRSIAFRYSTELNGTPTLMPEQPWDLRRLTFTVGYLTVWFDHLSGYIDTSTEEYQAMLKQIDVSPTS